MVGLLTVEILNDLAEIWDFSVWVTEAESFTIYCRSRCHQNMVDLIKIHWITIMKNETCKPYSMTFKSFVVKPSILLMSLFIKKFFLALSTRAWRGKSNLVKDTIFYKISVYIMEYINIGCKWHVFSQRMLKKNWRNN